jgi:hypothetical protein
MATTDPTIKRQRSKRRREAFGSQRSKSFNISKNEDELTSIRVI